MLAKLYPSLNPVVNEMPFCKVLILIEGMDLPIAGQCSSRPPGVGRVPVVAAVAGEERVCGYVLVSGRKITLRST